MASAILVLLVLTAAGVADESPHKSVQQYMSSKTTVVGWIDVSKVDAAELVSFLDQAVGSSPTLTDETEAIQEAMVQLGMTRIYWISDFSGLVDGPDDGIVVPVEKREAVALLLKSIGPRNDRQIVTTDNAVLIGKQQTIDRLKSPKDEPSAGLLATLDRNRDTHGFVFTTPSQAIMPVLTVLPRLADNNAELMAKAVESLVNIQSVSVSGELPPTKATIRVDLKTRESAKQLAEVFHQWVTMKLRDYDGILDLKVDGSSVLLQSGSVEQSIQIFHTVGRLSTGPRDQRAVNSLKQIALAMHNFHDVHKRFPAQALADGNGKRLLSWRVLILPYVDGGAELYNKFKLDEPWDSEHNKALIKEMPYVFNPTIPGAEPLGEGKTRFVAPLTESSAFGRPGQGTPIRDIIDGTSNTIMIVEAAPEHAVIWTKPDDITVELDRENPVLSIINANAEGFSACLCDGSVRFFPSSIAPGVFEALLTVNGREINYWDNIDGR